MENGETPLRLFTVEEANALLPVLRAQLADLAAAHRHLLDVAEEVERLERQRTPSNVLQLARPLREARERLGRAIEKRRAIIRHITARGVQIKSIEPALLDFPAWHDGRIVLLCWREGEPSVSYWHDTDAGFIGRQPL